MAAENSKATLSNLEQFLRLKLLDEWTAQGHNMNGKAIREIDFIAEHMGNSLRYDLMVLPYVAYNETGVPAAKIPFSAPSGRGGTSKYIQGLIRYAKVKFNLDDTSAKSAAFAIASKQKSERGMPTQNSYKYSSTGQRTGFITQTMYKNEEEIRRLLLNYADTIISVRFNSMLDVYIDKFKQ
jgi:hypothetical protein